MLDQKVFTTIDLVKEICRYLNSNETFRLASTNQTFHAASNDPKVHPFFEIRISALDNYNIDQYTSGIPNAWNVEITQKHREFYPPFFQLSETKKKIFATRISYASFCVSRPFFVPPISYCPHYGQSEDSPFECFNSY